MLRIAVLLGISLVAAGPAAAEEGVRTWLHEVSVGVLAHDVSGLWSGSNEEAGVDLHAALHFQPHRQLFRGQLRPYAGLTVNTRSDTSKVFAGGVWQYRTDSGWFARFGLGLAVHNGERETRRDDKKELGSKLLFHVPIELGRRIGERHRLSLYFDHISNAGLADENEGLDTLGLRYGYLF